MSASRSRIRWLVIAAVCIIAAAGVVIWTVGIRYAYEPSAANVISRSRPSPEAYDLWGRAINSSEAARLLQTDAGRNQLSAANGAVKIDDSLLRLGRKAFYKETFGNEVFLTDVLGILSGPLRITEVSRAILKLRGQGTTNLRVQVPETVTIGNRTFQKGSYFNTGLDVPAGALFPLGLAIAFSGGTLRAGITCAACHATVDRESKKVIEGAPNWDLNAGLLLALATNSAAYFMHTDVNPLQDVPQTRTGSTPLPDIAALEKAVDSELLMWPRGNFDSLTDMKADPTQNPVSFTWGNQPYGWSGNFIAGPFRGLSAQNNNVHALNSDSLLLAESSPTLLGIDTEVFLAIVLQNAASVRYRYDPRTGTKPSVFFQSVNPTPNSPGLNQVVVPPTFPEGTLLSPDGTFTSSPGHPFWRQNNAMAAWQNIIVPPRVRLHISHEAKDFGREVFDRAACAACHSGPFLTDNRVVPVGTIGANPIRAAALRKTELNFASPVVYAFDTPIPIPANARVLAVPTQQLDQEQIDLGWAHHGSPGGYKTPSLVGVYWTAPYLHDGGVAVGPNAESDLGIPGTVEQNIAPDPGNSLLALIDRELRARVVAANHASAALRRVNVEGIGHEYWIDAQAGYTKQQQQAVIGYLFTYEAPSIR